MIKSFARWLFMKCFYYELLAIGNELRHAQHAYHRDPAEGLKHCGRVDGAISVLEKLDLLVR